MDDIDYQQVRPTSLPVPDNTIGIDLLDAWPIKCAYAVQEIFKTEIDYITSLNDIIQGYRMPLSYRLKSDNEGHRTISTLFSNVDELHDMHKLFLGNLKTHQSDPHAFGQVFVTAENEFRIYCDYCTNYDGAVECLQNIATNDKEIDVFIKACQYNLSHALPLSSQLIKPVQRIMRYHIMLKEVVKHFDRNHHGFQSLESAYAGMIRLGKYINEEKKKKENADRIEDLQCHMTGWSGKDVKNLSAYGELIIEDTCKIGSKGIERQVILFDKLLLILKKKDAKRYTYKGHIQANELHVNSSFSEVNETMIKASSLLHRHQSYVLDLGSIRKQQNWLNKMHDLIHQVVEQARKGRLIASPEHQVKRRRIEEDNDELQAKEIDKGPRFSKVSRILSSRRRSHNDVRNIFPTEPTKLMSYSIGSDVTDGPMQDIPENEESSADKNQTEDTHKNHPQDVFLEPESNSKPSSKQVSCSSSMDSMVSLNDVDFGMEEHMTRKDMMEEGTTGISPREERKSKLLRRSAIKVKRSKTLHLSGSYSNIIKARALEVRAASISPTYLSPHLKVEADGEEGSATDDSDSVSYMYGGDYNQQSLQAVPVSDSSVPIISEPEVSLYGNEDGVGVDVTAQTLSNTKADDIVTRISPNKRPRPLSDAPSAEQDVHEVEIILDDGGGGDGDDGIELGESYGQSKLRGRYVMPSSGARVVADGDASDRDDLDQYGAGGFLNASSTSSYLDGSIEEEEAEEVGFMIVEDSSDSEDESVDEYFEDLEMEGSELESCFLEAAEMGEAALREEEIKTAMESTTTNGDLGNREVPMQENQEPWVPDSDNKSSANHVTEFFSTLNTYTGEPFKSTYDPSKNPSPYKCRASRKKHAADVYGTLPHKKKSSSGDLLGEKGPLPDNKQQQQSSDVPPPSYTTRRSDGFFRLLEFTRMQVEVEPADLDVTQSLPVLPVLDVNILPDHQDDSGDEVSTVQIFSDLPDDNERDKKMDNDAEQATDSMPGPVVGGEDDMDTDRKDDLTIKALDKSVEQAGSMSDPQDTVVGGEADNMDTDSKKDLIIESVEQKATVFPSGSLDTDDVGHGGDIIDTINGSVSHDTEIQTPDTPITYSLIGNNVQIEENTPPTADLAISVHVQSQLEDASLTTDLATNVHKEIVLESQLKDTSLTTDLATSVHKEDVLGSRLQDTSLTTDSIGIPKGDEVITETPNIRDDTMNPETTELVVAEPTPSSNGVALDVLARLSRVVLSRNGFVAVGVAVLASLVYYVWF